MPAWKEPTFYQKSCICAPARAFASASESLRPLQGRKRARGRAMNAERISTCSSSVISCLWVLQETESVLQCVVVCCSVLQCVAVCCSMLQCVAVCCQCVAVCCGVLSVCCGVLQCVAVCCSVLRCAAVRCSALQCVAVCSQRQTVCACALERRRVYMSERNRQ